MMDDMIIVSNTDVENINLNCKIGLGETSARFCYAAAGLPDDVISAFLDLLELYSETYRFADQDIRLT